MSEAGRPTILHLAVDFNTPYRAPTTQAVEWFIDELADLENVVVALRRTPLPGGLAVQQCFTKGGSLIFDLPYFGLPLGIGLHRGMKRAARRIVALLDRQGIRPDLVHAHKMTFEGLAGYYVARHYGVPLFLSLRGEVETKVFRFKPSLRPILREIADYAARLYFVSAWFEDEFRRHVPAPATRAKERRLPNIVRNISPGIVTRPANERFAAILNLDTRRRKGLRWLLDGFAAAADKEPAMRLDLIGGGSRASVEAVRAMIAARKLEDRVQLCGPMSNASLLEKLPDYRAMVLPSLNETFGMVYIEALFAGVPIIYTQGTAIDGYVDGLDVGITVPPRDVPAIAAALLDMWQDPARRRAAIVAAARQLFATFDPARALDGYRRDVTEVMGAARSSAQE